MNILALLLALGMETTPSQSEGVAISPSCEGKPPLFVAKAPDFLTSFNPARVGWGEDPMPVSFIASGDPCRGPVPVYRLTAWWGNEAVDSTHTMARRLAPLLKRYSQDTALEACARMCTTPQGKIVAQVVTIQSHISCQAPRDSCPANSTPTDETIHSHPPQRVFVANAVDAIGWDEPEIEGKLTPNGYPDSFSPNDRAAAPVWLVGTRGELIYLDKPEGREVERP